MRLALLLSLVLLVVSPPPLTVSAAISLTNALDTLGPLYTKAGGAEVRFNYGPSNTLARQIARGAPVDVFISADEAQMKFVEDAGAIVTGSRVKVLGNTLLLIRGRGKPGSGGFAILRDPQYRRIAIGDPEAVPAGVYARQWLMKEGLWHDVQPKLVPVSNVRAALAAVDNGTADAAFVYASDVASYHADRIEAVAQWLPDQIVYPAAIVKSSRNQAEAARFLKFLCGREAAAVFEQHKFIPLGCK